MKRILVFSDTHHGVTMCRQIINTIPCDLIIHAGDLVVDARWIEREFPDKEIIYVHGNCDMPADAPGEAIAEIGGVRIFIVHGHRHGVKFEHDYNTLIQAAKTAGCRVAVFGHTHCSYCEDRDGVLLLNPGSARYSYGVIEIEDGKPTACVIEDDIMF